MTSFLTRALFHPEIFTTERDQEHLKALNALINTAPEPPQNIISLGSYKISRLQTVTTWLCSQLTAKLCRNEVQVPKSMSSPEVDNIFHHLSGQSLMLSRRIKQNSGSK